MTKRLWISIENKNFHKKKKNRNQKLYIKNIIQATYINRKEHDKDFFKIQRLQFGNRISQYFVSQSPSNKHRWSTDDETSFSNIPRGMSPTIVLLSSRFETIPAIISFFRHVRSLESKVLRIGNSSTLKSKDEKSADLIPETNIF